MRKGLGKKKLRENFSNQNIETHNSHTFYLLFQKSVETKSQILRNLITNFSYSSFPADSIHYTILYFDIAHSSFLFCSLLSKIPRNMIAKEFFLYISRKPGFWSEQPSLNQTLLRISNIFRFLFSFFFLKRERKFFQTLKSFRIILIFVSAWFTLSSSPFLPTLFSF